MKTFSPPMRRNGFTLMETVIAIGVLSVLLTGFLIVFTPAADGIRKAISVQDADRLTSTLEQELVNTRPGETPTTATLTGFDRALQRIRWSTGPISGNSDAYATNPDNLHNALLVYQYRGDPNRLRSDGSPEPVKATTGKVGDQYILVTMMRRRGTAPGSLNPLLTQDLPAIEGPMFLVKCVQMVNATDGLRSLPVLNARRGRIYDPKLNTGGTFTEIDTDNVNMVYPDAVIAFAAEFYALPSKAASFFTGAGFTEFYRLATKPTFTRNLAVRR